MSFSFCLSDFDVGFATFTAILPGVFWFEPACWFVRLESALRGVWMFCWSNLFAGGMFVRGVLSLAGFSAPERGTLFARPTFSFSSFVSKTCSLPVVRSILVCKEKENQKLPSCRSSLTVTKRREKRFLRRRKKLLDKRRASFLLPLNIVQSVLAKAHASWVGELLFVSDSWSR